MQSKSLFFTKLPVEIRLLVYEKLLGWRTIYLEFYWHLGANRRWGWKFIQQQEWQERHWPHYAYSRAPWRHLLNDFCRWYEPCGWYAHWYEPLKSLEISMFFSCRQA